jgi:hypothetical protein
MYARLSFLVTLALLALANAQDEAAREAAATDTPEEPAPPVKCPLGGGGYQELYAVGMLLVNQDKMAEAEACFSDAVTTTIPAYRLLADITTSNGQYGRAAGAMQSPLSLLEQMQMRSYRGWQRLQ